MDGRPVVVVTGATGFLGQAVVARLEQTHDVIMAEGDLRMWAHARHAAQVARHHAAPLVHLAYPGGDGIGDALAHPATLAADLLQMDLNVIRAAAEAGVAKLVCIGSVCAYPEHTVLPTTELQLWHGYPEPVNASYGIVKRTQLALLQAYRQEYNLNGIHLILPNLYGPGDKTEHVVPALIRRMRTAKKQGGPLVVWGAPEVTRSFLYIDDAAEGIVRALAVYDRAEPLNLVNDAEVSMDRLVRDLATLLGFDGPVTYDPTRPAGHRRRQFSPDRMHAALDWFPRMPFYQGLGHTVQWHLEQERD